MDVFRFIAQTFCCPPIPSRIAAKIAFHPPTPASYKVSQDGRNCSFNSRMCNLAECNLEQMQIRQWPTFLGNKVTVVHVAPWKNPKKTLLCSHGNAGDVGLLLDCYWIMAMRLRCNVVCYDYSGYGGSTGKPSEADLYADVEAAWDCALQAFLLSPNSIILYGHSIGTVASLHLSCKVSSPGLVLVSPLASGLHILFPQTRFGGFFNNLAKIGKVSCPTLIAHGEGDSIVDSTHSRLLVSRAPPGVASLHLLPSLGHNDIEMSPDFLSLLDSFLDKY